MECVPDIAFLTMPSASIPSKEVYARASPKSHVYSKLVVSSEKPAQNMRPAVMIKPRKTNFTPREVEVLLAAVSRRRDTVLFGVAGGQVWARAWQDVAREVSAVEGIRRTEGDVRKKWTYLKWEAKNTSKPGRDPTSRAVLKILTGGDPEASARARSLLEELLGMAGPKNQVWKDISRALNSKISADGLYTFVKCNRHNIQHIINTEDDDAIMPMHTSEVCGLVPQQNVGSPISPPTNIPSVPNSQEDQVQKRLSRTPPVSITAVPILGNPQEQDLLSEVCLRWNAYHSNMQSVFPYLLNSEQFVDVTLATEGQSIKCHKVMLSACSTYFEQLLSQNPCQHPIVIMKDLRFWEVQALVDFMYRGEVSVSQDKLKCLLAAADALQIKGLAGSAAFLPNEPSFTPQTTSNEQADSRDEQQYATPAPTPTAPNSASPAFLRRIRKRKNFSSPLMSPPPLYPFPKHRQNYPDPCTYQYESPHNTSRTQIMDLPSSNIKIEKDDSPPLTKRRAQSPIMPINPIMIKTEPEDIEDINDFMDPLADYDADNDKDNLNPIRNEYERDINTLDNREYHLTLDRKTDDDQEPENSCGSSRGVVFTPEILLNIGEQSNDDEDYDDDEEEEEEEEDDDGQD